MNYWLMKTEPGTFSFDDLLSSPQRTASWEGVRNYQARNLMRDEFKTGDRVLIYHSGIDEPAVVGVAEVVRPGYPDHFAMDPKSRYFDPDAARRKLNPWVMVDVKGLHPFRVAVTRNLLKADSALKSMMVLRRGARLSVQPVAATEFHRILQLGQVDAKD